MEEAVSARKWTLVAVCLTTFMLLLDITIVVVALPSIQRRFDASLTGLQWVVDAYALTLATLILTAGALADRYGRRLVFMTGVVLFTFASLLCGLAWSTTALDVARALQGIGGAALFATALALIGHEYRGPERFGALAIWGATVGAAVACGPLIGGILTDALGWRWIFFVNIPVGVFALSVALTRISESRDEGAKRTDVQGLVTFSAALFLIVFGILRGNARGWSSGLILSSLVGGVLLLLLFVLLERRQVRPMLDVTREDVAALCRALHLRPRHDPTNADTTLLRNALRLDAIPAIERSTGREVKRTFARTADHLQRDATTLFAQADQHAKTLIEVHDRGFAIRARPLLDLPPALSSRVARRGFQRADLGWDHEAIDAVLDLAAGSPGRKRDLLLGIRARRTRTHVEVEG